MQHSEFDSALWHTTVVLQVLQVTGISSSNDTEFNDVYCVLSTGTCRFTTRSLPIKRNSTPWPESFLLSPQDIKHASQRITPTTATLNSPSAPSPTSATADAAVTPDDIITSISSSSSTRASSSPVLSIELWSSKRWGADTVTAAGELLLAPYLSSLRPNGPPMQARVALRNPKATSKATAKSGRAASGASVSSSPGLESGWVLGAEVQVLVLELVAIAASKLPVNLLGKTTCSCLNPQPDHLTAFTR